MRNLVSLALVTLAVFAFSVSFAEEQPEAPQPTAEHKAMEMWIGKWSGTAEMKPSDFGPGGEMTWTEDCSWFAGSKFNVVCKSKGTGPMGQPMEGLGIMGYNAGKKVYTHYGVDSSGWSGYAEGTRSGDSYTFQSEETMEGQTFQSRFTMILKSPKLMTFTWEMSEDGKTWMAMMEGTSQKQ